jgi:hypothetical protein
MNNNYNININGTEVREKGYGDVTLTNCLGQVYKAI